MKKLISITAAILTFTTAVRADPAPSAPRCSCHKLIKLCPSALSKRPAVFQPLLNRQTPVILRRIAIFHEQRSPQAFSLRRRGAAEEHLSISAVSQEWKTVTGSAVGP
jgi:hypothetical protein